MQPMDPTAQGFMVADTLNTPMHVGGLQLFQPPEDAGPTWAREYYESVLDETDVAPLFHKRPRRSLLTAGSWAWEHDRQFDLEHHVRHSALPAPGRVREMLELVSRLHGQRMTFDRPLWEFHLIEGLADGRIGVYTKLHHAMVDGVSAMRLLQATLSTDPTSLDSSAPWANRPRSARSSAATESRGVGLLDLPLGALRSALAIGADAAGLPAALVRTLNRGIRNEAAPIALFAPKTIFNQHISAARRFAAQQWEIDRIKAIGKASGCTINDVVLAMCSGALRRYLIEQGALPSHSLVAMVPISLKLDQAGSASTDGGNAVGSIMVKLSTDLDDSADRLESIHHNIKSGRNAMATMSQTQIMAMSGLGVSPLVILPMLRMQGITRPPFNLVISNVPGPSKPLYLKGARLDGMYPLSIPVHGQAMNITCVSYDGMLNFGVTGCRRTVPRLQRLLTHLDEELASLERAVIG